MKKFMSVILAAGLILAGASVAFASGEWTKAEDGKYFDEASSTASNATQQYPVLLSSGVYLNYVAEKAGSGDADPYLYYYMETVSVRGDKCYGTGHSSTLIAMVDLQNTGNTECTSHDPNFADNTKNVEWSGWTKTDGSPLPAEMTGESNN
jgi:hypothetical protein